VQETYDYSESGNFYNELYPTVNYNPKEQLIPRSKDAKGHYGQSKAYNVRTILKTKECVDVC